VLRLTRLDQRLTRLLAGIESTTTPPTGWTRRSTRRAADTAQLEPRCALLASRQALTDSRRTAPLREGHPVAIAGANVGKSTLFNALLGHERALTAPEPGTTRDYLSERVDCGGFNLTLIDTAGYRDSADALEAAGVRRAGDWARSADTVLWISAADRAEAGVPAELAGIAPRSVVTRCDLLKQWPAPEPGVLHVSGKTGRGVAELWDMLHASVESIALPALAAFSQRQAHCLEAGAGHLRQALIACDRGLPLDAVAQDLYQARRALHNVFEQDDRGAVIAQIFSSFCVGK
jgi:tRNA modification GTPase